MVNNTTNILTPAMTPGSPALITHILLASYIIALILGSTGNTLVLIVVVGKRSKRTVNDTFIMNLAVSDLLFICFLPLFIYENVTGQMVEKNVAFCKFISPTITTTYLLSIFTLTSMSVHRCQVIINPFKRELSQKETAVWIALIWCLAFLVILPLIIVSNINPGDTTVCSEAWPNGQYKKGYTVALFVIQYVIPLFVIAISYIRIGLDLNRSSSSQPKYKQPNRRICRARRKENMQVIKTLATIVILFALLMLPGQICWLIQDFGAEEYKQEAAKFATYFIPVAIFHSCLNPLVYGTVTRQFRRDYVRYLAHLLCCCPKTKRQIIKQCAGSPQNTDASQHQHKKNREDDSHFEGYNDRCNGASVPLCTNIHDGTSPVRLVNDNSNMV